MPSGFMPNGMVANHSIAGSFVGPVVTPSAMNASMVPCEAASKHSNGWHDLAAREDLDPEPPAAHLLDDLRQPLGRALEYVEHRGARPWTFATGPSAAR